MAIQKANLNTLYVGDANPPTTKVLNKSSPSVDGGKHVLDDITTDDSTAPEKAVIYAGNIETVSFDQLVNTADASYAYLRTKSENGATLFAAHRPEGDGTGKRQGIFACVCMRKPKLEVQKYARDEFTLTATGGTTWSNQP